MRDFYFFTSKPMTACDCYDLLNSEIKNIRGSSSPDEKQISIDGKYRSYLWFQNERIEDYWFCTEEEFAELRKQIPLEKPYINHFETHRSVDAKRIIKVLIRIYPELYIDINDDTAWQGTAQEYLDTEFDY